MELRLSSWKGEEIVLDVSLLEGSKCPANTATLQAETTTISINSGHQSPCDTALLPRRMETLKAPWKKPTTCNDCSLLQSTQTSIGGKPASFSVQNGASSSGLKQLKHTAHPSRLYSVKFKNACSYTVTTIVCMA
jgi:hypothetical protein